MAHFFVKMEKHHQFVIVTIVALQVCMTIARAGLLRTRRRWTRPLRVLLECLDEFCNLCVIVAVRAACGSKIAFNSSLTPSRRDAPADEFALTPFHCVICVATQM